MKLTEEEIHRVEELFTPAELVESLDLDTFEHLGDLFEYHAQDIRDILEEF